MSRTNIIDGFHGDVFTFARLKEEGIVGIIHKATQSTTIDPRYKARRKQRRDRVLWGAFDLATDSDWEEEVKRFLDVTEPGFPKSCSKAIGRHGPVTTRLCRSKRYSFRLARMDLKDFIRTGND